MPMHQQHLQILFFGLFRQYANQRLMLFNHFASPQMAQSPSDPISLSDFSSFSSESLDEMEITQSGSIKLSGENSLVFSDAKFGWLNKNTYLGDIFMTVIELNFFDQMFRHFLSSSGLISHDLESSPWLNQNMSIEEYINECILKMNETPIS